MLIYSGIKAFDPWMKRAEQRISDGLLQPRSLVEACEILGTSKVGGREGRGEISFNFSDLTELPRRV